MWLTYRGKDVLRNLAVVDPRKPKRMPATTWNEGHGFAVLQNSNTHQIPQFSKTPKLDQLCPRHCWPLKELPESCHKTLLAPLSRQIPAGQVLVRLVRFSISLHRVGWKPLKLRPINRPIQEMPADLKRAPTSPPDVEIRQIVARPFLLLSSIMVVFYCCCWVLCWVHELELKHGWILEPKKWWPVRANLLKESDRGGKHSRQESQLKNIVGPHRKCCWCYTWKYCWCYTWKYCWCYTWKYCWCYTWKCCWCFHENTADAHMKASVRKCDQEKEHAWLGKQREEGPDRHSCWI